MKLNDLMTFPHPAGLQHKELFENGYGISVIPEVTQSEEPLYEVAVLAHNEGKFARITYDSGVTDNVIRFCTENAVDSLIERISTLPTKEI
jgi:hypothetical protein